MATTRNLHPVEARHIVETVPGATVETKLGQHFVTIPDGHDDAVAAALAAAAAEVRGRRG